MMKLYYAPGACSLAPHMVLEETGAEYESQKVNLRAGEQRTPEYLAINPKGAVPALQTERGVLTENPAVLAYIAANHPEAGLSPQDDPFEAASLLSFNNFLSGSVHPALGKLLFAPLDDDAKAAQRELAMSKLRLVEDRLFKGPWAMGERFTTADPYLAVFARWARQAGLLDESFPKLNAHLDRVQERPAARRALEREGLEPV